MPYPWEVGGGWASAYLQQQADRAQQISVATQQQRAQQQAQAQQMAQEQAFQQQRDANLAAYQQQHTAQQAAIQQHRDVLQNYFGEQQDFRQAGIQGQRDVRQAELQRQQTTHATDEQGRLNQIELGHAEQMRLARLKQARSAIEANQDLSPQERQQLIMQVESGLNPLENRVRESQMLHSSIQNKQAQQQMQQQATLFNQHQQWLSQGIQGQLQTVIDPNTGMPGLFHVDARGQIQQLDFSQQQQLNQLRLEQGQQSIARGRQEMQQSGALFPGELGLQQQRLLSGQQTYQQNEQIFPLDQRLRAAQAGGAELNLQFQPGQLEQRRQMGVLQLQQLGNEVAAQPQNTMLQQRYQGLRNQLLDMEVANNPDVTRLHNEHSTLQNQYLRGQITDNEYQIRQRPIMGRLAEEHQRIQNQLQTQILEGNLTPSQRRQELDVAVRRVDDRLRDMGDSAFTRQFGQPNQGETPQQHRARVRSRLVQEEYRRSLELINPQGGAAPAPAAPPPANPADMADQIIDRARGGANQAPGWVGQANAIPGVQPFPPGFQQQVQNWAAQQGAPAAVPRHGMTPADLQALRARLAVLEARNRPEEQGQRDAIRNILGSP